MRPRFAGLFLSTDYTDLDRITRRSQISQVNADSQSGPYYRFFLLVGFNNPGYSKNGNLCYVWKVKLKECREW